MAHILGRKQADGSIRYTAVVRLRKGKTIVHREAKTFSHRGAAEKWAKSREVALESPGALIQARHGEKSLSDLIRWYIDSFADISGWKRTKQSQLEFLEKHPIGKSNAFSLTAGILIDHVKSRRNSGAGAATVGNDLTWIGVVLRAARSVDALPVNPEVVEEARTACRELRLIAKSRRRDRRPTPDELVRLDDYFSRRDMRSKIPMQDIMWFAIHSARREAEICRLEVADNHSNARTGMVRDVKHPRFKDGNHRRFKYTQEAWEIVKKQPKQTEFVFPYDPKSVGAAFTRACHFLGVKDLRFHDLRHEATSRLFERGYDIHEVAQFTLHESWNDLKRYTHLRPEKVREIQQQRPEEIRSSKRRQANGGRATSLPSLAGDRSHQQGQMHSPATVTSARPI